MSARAITGASDVVLVARIARPFDNGAAENEAETRVRAGGSGQEGLDAEEEPEEQEENVGDGEEGKEGEE